MFTYDQFLRHFFTKPNLNRREARWIDLCARFGINQIDLKPGRVHVLGGVLSRAPHVMEENVLHNVNLCGAEYPFDFEAEYEHEQLCGQIVRELKEVFPEDMVQRNKVSRLLPPFKYVSNKLLYAGKMCVPKLQVKNVLYAAYDASVSGHFGFVKTLGRLENLHWRHKSRDMKKYVGGCQICQQKNDGRFAEIRDTNASLRTCSALGFSGYRSHCEITKDEARV